MTDEREAYRRRIRAELVKKYAIDGTNMVTYVNFAQIHAELRGALLQWDMSNL